MPNLIKKIKSKIRKIFLLNGFQGSRKYWKNRYEKGGTSGPGSYGHLAQFKAEILNNFVQLHNVRSIIEFGCGDGNQLKLSSYPSYIGFDISEESIKLCSAFFSNDISKRFRLMDKYANETAELTLSLDVIFHLTEDEIYHSYMHRLFDASTKYVIVYSSNTEQGATKHPAHVRHRLFTLWVEKHKPGWKLVQNIPNKYPFDGTEKTSFSDFYVFQK